MIHKYCPGCSGKEVYFSQLERKVVQQEWRGFQALMAEQGERLAAERARGEVKKRMEEGRVEEEEKEEEEESYRMDKIAEGLPRNVSCRNIPSKVKVHVKLFTCFAVKTGAAGCPEGSARGKVRTGREVANEN